MAASLAAIALSKVDADSGKASKGRGLYPEERAKACSLLGTLGSRESRDVLALVIREDGEITVRAAAAEALGTIGWDGDGFSCAVLKEACGTVYRPGTDRLIAASAGAIERILRYEGVPTSDDGIDALLAMAEFPLPQSIRTRVLSALKAAIRP